MVRRVSSPRRASRAAEGQKNGGAVPIPRKGQGTAPKSAL